MRWVDEVPPEFPIARMRWPGTEVGAEVGWGLRCQPNSRSDRRDGPECPVIQSEGVRRRCHPLWCSA